jgi:hypothetical protein
MNTLIRNGKCKFCGDVVETGTTHTKADCPYFETSEALITQQMIDTVEAQKELERVTRHTYPYRVALSLGVILKS